jgi:two-component system, LuxR family, response regulator FixJ
MKADPTVFVVEDSTDVQTAVQWLLRKAGYQARGFVSAESFLEECDPGVPGCLLLDLRLPGMGGLELQERMVAQSWSTPIIVVSGHADVSMAVQALEAGAFAFIQKPVARHVLLERVRLALDRDEEIRGYRAERAELDARFAMLTPRERQVMALVVLGRTSRQIAGELGATAKTIEVHRRRVMSKTGASGVAELVAMAIRCDLAGPGVLPAPRLPG